MEKITKYYEDYSGCVVYMEKSDCKYYQLGRYDEFHSEYPATDIETGETTYFKQDDLIGNYVDIRK